MGIDWQISFASKTLYFIGVVAVIHALTSGLFLVTWILGSGIVDVGSAYVLSGKDAGYGVELLGALAFFAGGYSVANRNVRVMPGLLLFLIADCLVLFGKLAPLGIAASGIGILASFLIVFHGIVFWCVLRAYLALRQARTNAAIVKQLDFDAELRRRLSESDEPAPPAATFDTRFRWTPPAGPTSPRHPQA